MARAPYADSGAARKYERGAVPAMAELAALVDSSDTVSSGIPAPS